jgi:hypothetical protein
VIGSKTEEPKTAFADMSILHYPLSTDPIGMLLFFSFRGVRICLGSVFFF